MYAVKSLERDGIEGLVRMAKTADMLIACIPLTAETASIIDEKVIDPSPYPPHQSDLCFDKVKSSVHSA